MFIPLVEIKTLNALTDNKSFSDQPVKSKEEPYKMFIVILRNNDYTAGNLLDYLYHQNYHKINGIDLSRLTNMSIPQQINFTKKLEGGNGATISFIGEKQQKTLLNLSLDSLILTE